MINAVHQSPLSSPPFTDPTLVTFTPLSQVPMAVLSSKEHQATTRMVTLAVASSVGRRTGPIASIEDICAKRSRGELRSERRHWLPVAARQSPGPLASVNTVTDTIRQPTQFVYLLLLHPLKLRPLPKRHRFPAA